MKRPPVSMQLPQAFARTAAVAVCVVGILVLFGWTIDSAALKSIVLGGAKIPPITALTLILASCALWGLSRTKKLLGGKRTLGVPLLAGMVASIGACKLAEFSFGWQLNLDALGFRDELADGEPRTRMGHITAAEVLILGGALFFAQGRRSFAAFQLLVLTGGLIAWLGFSRYLYGGEPLLPYTQMSVLVASCFLLLNGGVFCVRSDRGLLALLLSDSPGGLLTRRVLFPALVVPFVIGWLRLKGQQAGLFGTETGLALFALSNVLLFAFLIWATAVLLDRLDLGRRQADRQRDESINEVKDMKAALDEHAIVAMTDARGRITYVNDKFCAISQFSREELIGRDHRIINSGHHPKEFIRELWTTILSGKVWHGEIKNKAKDGSFYWVDTTLVPFLTEAGKPRQYVAIRADITERKRLEYAAMESRKRLLLTLDAAKLGSWDLDLKTLEATRSLLHDQIFGYPELLPAWSYDQFLSHVNSEDRERVDRLFQAGVAAKSDWDVECRIRREDGEERWIWAHGNVFTDEAGEAARMGGIVSDITARKLLERARQEAEEKILRLNTDLEQRVAERTAQLELANKELESFSYSVSHDLRAPLRAVNGFAEIVLEVHGHAIPEGAVRYLERIRNGGQRMGQLIDDLLTFSRLGRRAMSRQTVDCNKLVHNVLDELSEQSNGREIEWRIDSLPACRSDPALLKQVWINLISNSIKYTRGRKPARIEIGSANAGSQVTYRVCDNGTGFDMRYANKLFGVFQRLHRADEFEGTGVGLAIVQRIVRRHGGNVWADAAPGRGATFWFTLEGDNTHE